MQTIHHEINRSTILFRALVTIILLSAANTAAARTLYVEKWGLDSQDCSKSSPCLTIQKALDRAAARDRIVVGPGVYEETLEIDEGPFGPLEGLRLESSLGKYATTITRGSPNRGTIIIKQSKVRLGKKNRGFTITGAITNNGVELDYGVDLVRVEDNRMIGNSVGLKAETTSQIVITDNEFINNFETGMSLGGARDSFIRRNRVSGSRTGMWMSYASGAKVERNIISNNSERGIVTGSHSWGILFRDNVIETTGDFHGLYLPMGAGSIIRGNIISRNALDGVNLHQVYDYGATLIRDNLVVANGSNGFEFNDLLETEISGNTVIQNNNDGIFLAPGVQARKFHANNTFGNDTADVHCGLYNNTYQPFSYSKHYFGSGDSFCGGSVQSASEVDRPGRIKVQQASKL